MAKIVFIILFGTFYYSSGYAATAFTLDRQILWQNSQNIPICFESIEFYLTDERSLQSVQKSEISKSDQDRFAEAKRVVQQAIEEQFSRVPNIGFSGFGDCSDIPKRTLEYARQKKSKKNRESNFHLVQTDFDGLRIYLKKEVGGVSKSTSEAGRGKFMGLILGLETGEDCNESWQRCLIHTTLHEIGHTLGLAHEHERFDAPECSMGITNGTEWFNSPSDQFLAIGAYDPYSIMNYCANAYHYNADTDIAYTELDIAALNYLYTLPAIGADAEAKMSQELACVESGGSLLFSENVCCDRAILEPNLYTAPIDNFTCVPRPPLGGWTEDSI